MLSNDMFNPEATLRARHQGETNNLTDRLKDAERMVNALRVENTSLRAEVERLQAGNTQWEQERNKANVAKEQAFKERDDVRGECERLRAELEAERADRRGANWLSVDEMRQKGES